MVFTSQNSPHITLCNEKRLNLLLRFCNTEERCDFFFISDIFVGRPPRRRTDQRRKPGWRSQEALTVKPSPATSHCFSPEACTNTVPTFGPCRLDAISQDPKNYRFSGPDPSPTCPCNGYARILNIMHGAV
jgi:hypothetical protein